MTARATIGLHARGRARDANGSRLAPLLRPSLATRAAQGPRRLELVVDDDAPLSTDVRLVRPRVAGFALLSAIVFALSSAPFELGFVVGWFVLVPSAVAILAVASRRSA